MGQIQMLFLVAAIVTFSIFNLMVMKQTLVNMEIRCEFEVANDMYKISYKANEYHDSVGTYIGYEVSPWLENTPFGSMILNIATDEIIINGNVSANGREFTGIITPSGYHLE